MSLRNHPKYAIRHLVRNTWWPVRRAVELQAREVLTEAERQAARDQRLHVTLTRAAATIPAYAFLSGKVPRSGLAQFIQRNLPIVDKSDLLARRQHYYPRSGRPLPWWSVGKTSGTSGTPLDVFRSLDSTRWEQAFHLQHWRWAGFDFAHERQVVLRGDLVVPLSRKRPPYWFHDRSARQLFVSTRHLNDDAAPHIAAEVARFGATQLRAYPSAAFELARLSEAHKLPMRFRSIVTSSESLYATQREQIARVLGGQVFDLYGMAERTVFGAECEYGSMHVHPEYSLVEIVDSQDRPTDGEGQLVGTTFHNLAMPLLRYRLNDSARWSHAACRCGRTYPIIEALCGKVEQQVFDLDGAVVSPSVVTFAFKGVHNIRKAQVAQTAHDLWTLRIVPDAAFSDRDGQALLANFRTLVSERLNVEIEVVQELANLPSGKFMWIVQEWAGGRRIASHAHSRAWPTP